MASLVEVPEKHPGALNESMEGANFVKELWFVESIGGGVVLVMEKEKSYEVERKPRVKECLRAMYLFLESRLGSQAVRMTLAPSNSMNSMAGR